MPQTTKELPISKSKTSKCNHNHKSLESHCANSSEEENFVLLHPKQSRVKKGVENYVREGVHTHRKLDSYPLIYRISCSF